MTAAELLDEDLAFGRPHPPYVGEDGRVTYRSPKGHMVDYDLSSCERRYWQVTGKVPGGHWPGRFHDPRLRFFIHVSEEDAEALRRLEAKHGCTETCVRPAWNAGGALMCIRDENYARGQDKHGRDAEIVKGSRVTLRLELNGLRVKPNHKSLTYRVSGVVVH
jgi:hypothetical protein